MYILPYNFQFRDGEAMTGYTIYTPVRSFTSINMLQGPNIYIVPIKGHWQNEANKVAQALKWQQVDSNS